MSMTKAGANYARHMDELFEADSRDNDLQEFLEYQYLQSIKPAPTGAQTPKQNERPETDKQA